MAGDMAARPLAERTIHGKAIGTVGLDDDEAINPFAEIGHLVRANALQGSGFQHLENYRHLGGLEAETLLQPRQTGGAEAPNGNSVSLEEEMVKAASARQDHEMALAIYRNTSDIIRASLGRK